MKKPIIAIAALIVAATGAWAMPDGWTDDFDDAKAQAAAEGKAILVHFEDTPCESCGTASSRNAGMLSKAEFVEAAKKDYLLVDIKLPPKHDENLSERRNGSLRSAACTRLTCSSASRLAALF